MLALILFGLPLRESLLLLFEGAFGDRAGLSRTFVKAIPLILCGLGMVVAWRAGQYNIGGEGQFVIGALAGASIAPFFASKPGPLANFAILTASVLGGALLAALPGWLQVARGVQVVISTILLNFVAIQALGYAVTGPLKRPTGLPLTPQLPDKTMLLRFDRQLDLHAGIFYVLFATVLLWILLFRTSWGLKLRFVGANPFAARASGIPSNRIVIGSMALSGALCGLAGGIEYTGITGTLGSGFPQGWGFMAIPVALLGGLHPIGVLASGTLFGALFAGSENLGRFTSGGATMVFAVQALTVLAIVARGFELPRGRAKLEANANE